MKKNSIKLIQLQLIVILFSATPPNDAKDVPIEDTTKNNTKVIVIVLTLLALLILITLIVFYVMYVRRRNFKKQGNSFSSIYFFAIKTENFLSHKNKSPECYFVILTFIHKICSLKDLLPADCRGLKLLAGQHYFFIYFFFNI